jgi:chitinase
MLHTRTSWQHRSGVTAHRRLVIPALALLAGACVGTAGSKPRPAGGGGSGMVSPPAAGSGGAGGSGGTTGGTGGGAAGAGGAAGGAPGGPGPGIDAASPGPLGAGGAGDASDPGDVADARIPVGPPPPPPPEFRAPGIVAYWGQNSYGSRTTDRTKYETTLAETCQANPQYEAVVVAFVNRFVVPADMSSMPLVNFSRHCNNKYAFAQCDEIGRGINECQRLGKKVLISLGGATGGYGLRNEAEGRAFAQSTWDLFLDGQSSYRPFDTAVVDGVDLDIEGGAIAGYSGYVRRLRELMNGDKSRRWYITGAPQCPFPDAYLGPAAGRALGDAASLFDYLFVQFYNNPCGGFNPDFMVMAFNQWAKVGPKILVGLPAAADAGGGFVGRAALPALLARVKGSPAFAGVMLWDASYDQNSLENGQSYSAFARSLLK